MHPSGCPRYGFATQLGKRGVATCDGNPLRQRHNIVPVANESLHLDGAGNKCRGPQRDGTFESRSPSVAVSGSCFSKRVSFVHPGCIVPRRLFVRCLLNGHFCNFMQTKNLEGGKTTCRFLFVITMSIKHFVR